MTDHINSSGIEPRGRAVLVQAYEPEIKRGLLVLPENVAVKGQMVEMRAVVIATGNDAWSDEAEPRAVPGDKVLITKYAGVMAVGTADGKQYRLINDRDIFARITQETTS